ncbi:uncharacterized protein [Nicotiana sylvestris]|uniref:uncharacterized protein n=1 Tax=Nicotiana sylvestris TaxID=4096 RepID=UPI00388CEBBD
MQEKSTKASNTTQLSYTLGFSSSEFKFAEKLCSIRSRFQGNSRSCWRQVGRMSTSKREQLGRALAKGGGKRAYAPQVGLDEEIKRRFWEGLDDISRSIPPSERLFVEEDFNGHIGSSAGGYTEVHNVFGFGERNGGGTSLLDFAKAFDLVIANSSFPKREEHLVTYQNSVARTQIDYLLLKRYDRRLCEDCKVILGETFATQHRLLVMDISIMIRRKQRSVRDRPRIRWSALTKDKAQELEGRLLAMESWRSSGDANNMWSTMTDYIKKEVREVLGISSVRTGGHEGDWWWNAVVQGKVEAKKVAYLQLVGSTSEEEKRANIARYKELGRRRRLQ